MNERINELMSRAYYLPKSPARAALVEEAIRESDALGDGDLSFELRMEYLDATNSTGHLKERFVAFSWMLAFFDENRDRFDARSTHDLLWRYKWLLDSVADFPQLEWSHVIDMQNDMERRYREFGFSLRPVQYFRFSNALRSGKLKEASELLPVWKKLPRDELADCRACELNKEIRFFAAIHEDEQAIEVAEPILAGRSVCAEIPHFTYPLLIRPAIRLQQFEEGQQFAKAGIGYAKGNPEFLTCLAEFLLFYTAKGDFKRAIRLLEKNLHWALESANLYRQMQFYSTAAALFSRLVQEERNQLKLHLPQAFVDHQANGEYETAALQSWFTRESQSLADRFDRRNENDYFRGYIGEANELATAQYP